MNITQPLQRVRRFHVISGILLTLGVLVVWPDNPASAADAFYPISVPLQKPRTKALPDRSEPADKMEYGLWIPDGVEVVRGIICNPFTKNPLEAPQEMRHWHVMGRLWGFAYIVSDFNGTSSAEFGPTLQAALVMAAKESGHTELAHAPFLFMGTSRGGGWSRKLAEHFPERTIAVAPTNLVVGPDSEVVRSIPFWTTVGEKDGGQFPSLLEKLPVIRKDGGQWGAAVLWGARHEFLFTNNLAIPFFDEVIRQRYPADQLPREKPVVLKPYPQDRVWLGDVTGWKEKLRVGPIAPAAEYDKSAHEAVWIPGPDLAHAWRAFVSESKQVKITQPPGLGGGQAFILHAPDQDIAVTLKLPATARKVSLFDGERLIEAKEGAAAEFAIRLQPGVHPVYAVVETADGLLYSRPHTLLVRKP